MKKRIFGWKRAGVLVMVLALGLTACQTAVTTNTQTTSNAAQPNAQATVVSANAAGTGSNAVRSTVAAGNNAASTQQTAPQAQAPAAQAAVQTLSVDGTLALHVPLVTAAFESSGKVATVNVKPGQTVKQGDVLAVLDSEALNTALQSVQEALTLKEAEIANSLAPATTTQLNSAKTSLSSAYAAYNELKAGADATEVEEALRSLNQAKNSLYSTQLNRDEECGWVGKVAADKISPAGDPDCKEAQLSVLNGELRVQTAEQNYADAQAPATQAELTKAWANVLQAQASLASLQNGVTAEEQAVYDLQLAQAKESVARAERNMSNAQLVSPCDCVVQDVTISAGAEAAGSITLLDISQLKFQTSNLSELNVLSVQAGQKATIRLRAFDDVLTGEVESVLPVSSGTSGDVALFTTLIKLDETDLALLPGMTGAAEIEYTSK